MGIFSSKKKTSVTSVVYPLMGDGGQTETPDYMQQTILYASQMGYDVTQRINSYVMNGRYWTLLRAFKEAQQNYPIGLPTCRYTHGSKDPTDYKLNEGVVFGTNYFPNLICRYTNKDFLDPNIKGEFKWLDTKVNLGNTSLYNSTKQILKILDIPIQDLKDQINKNESIKDIDNAFVVTAVDIATQTEWGNQYLYEFFNSLLAIQGVNRTSFEGSVGGSSYSTIVNLGKVNPEALQNVLLFRDTDPGQSTYFSSIEWSYIEKATGTGIVGDGVIGNVEKTTTTLSKLHDLSRSIVTFTKQIGVNQTETLMIHGLLFKNNIYKDKLIEVDAVEAINDREEVQGFLIPVDMDILAQLPIATRHQLTSEIQWMVFNCAKQVKKKWYQSGVFGTILTIAGIALAFMFPPAWAATSTLMTVTYVAGVTLLLPIILEAIPSIALKLGKMIGLSGEQLEAFVAIVTTAATIAVIAYSQQKSIKGAFSAMNWMQATSAVLNGATYGVNAYIEMNMTELQKKAVAQQKKYEDAMQSVEELWDYLTPDMNNGWLSVQSSVDSMKSIILDTPEIFLKRTLLTGQDIVNFTFLEIEKYVENTIRLDFVEPISIPLGISIERQII